MMQQIYKLQSEHAKILSDKVDEKMAMLEKSSADLKDKKRMQDEIDDLKSKNAKPKHSAEDSGPEDSGLGNFGGILPVNRLIIAIKTNDMSEFKKVLSSDIDVNISNQGSFIALIWATDLDRYDMVKKLLDKGASPTKVCSNSWTPLHQVAKKGFLNIVQALINEVDTLDTRDKNGKTPLYIACECNN